MDKLYDTVTDTEGRPISGATVSVMNEDTGSAQTLYTILGASLGTTTTTNDAGYYEAFVPDGSYVITVSYPVLNPITRTRVKVSGERTFSNLAALRLAKTATLTDGDLVTVLSHTSGAAGGGTFYWSASSADADDNGITILPTGHVGNGRWKREYSGPISLDWFDKTATGIQAAINAIADGSISLFTVPSGTYTINSALSAGTRKLIWIMEGDVTLSGTSPTLPGNTITFGTKQQTVVGQGTFSPFVDQHMNIIPETSQHHFGLVVGMDATGQTDGKDKCSAYFAANGNGAVDLWGANTLVRLESGYSGGANSIEVDINNNSGSDGKGVGVLINGASANKILAGMIVRMNGGPAGGQQGIRIEDDWDNQLMLQGALTNATFNAVDSGNNALLNIDQTPVSGTDTAQVRFFRSTVAASLKLSLHNNSATENITLDASNGRLSGIGRVTAMSATSIPAGGTAGSGFLFSSTANFGIFFGSGAPSLSAAKGSLYLRSDGTTTNDRAYINTDGSTTWTALTTVA